jgi:hypothetical protein
MDIQEMLQRHPLCYIQIEPDKAQSRRMKSRPTSRERGRVAMDEIESEAQSFIVRVWVEERAEGGGHSVWRGHITHVHSSRRQYLKNLDEIGDFIAPYLKGMGVKLGTRWQITHWLKHLLG